MMKIAIFQGCQQPQSVEQNISSLGVQARNAATEGACLLIAPEMFLTGYNIGPQTVRERAEAADGESAQRIANVAKEAGIAVLYGYPELHRDAVYNSAQVIDKNGQSRANYRKTHLFGDIDRDAFSAGKDETVLFELDGWSVGILICYDVEFPENVRRLALKGVDLVVVPTALMKPYEFVPRSLVPSRAYENQVFVAYANRCGSEKELEYYGLSCIVGPDGKDLARADTDEGLIVGELDRDTLETSRQLNTFLNDRRPELYRALSD